MSKDEKVKLGRILLKQKLVSNQELDTILTEQKNNGNSRLASKLLEKGLADEKKLLNALSIQHNVQSINLDELEISLICLDSVSLEIAEKYLILPIWTTFDTIHLAMANPGDHQVIREVESASEKRIIPLVALQSQLKSTIDACYKAYSSGQRVYRGPKMVAREREIDELDVSESPKERNSASNI